MTAGPRWRPPADAARRPGRAPPRAALTAARGSRLSRKCCWRATGRACLRRRGRGMRPLMSGVKWDGGRIDARGVPCDLLLELEDALEQRLRAGWEAGALVPRRPVYAGRNGVDGKSSRPGGEAVLQVPPVGDLVGAGGCFADGGGVGAGPASAHDPGAGVFLRPGDEGGRVPVREDVDYPFRLHADQDRAMAPPGGRRTRQRR
jgi:hypothetical protein